MSDAKPTKHSPSCFCEHCYEERASQPDDVAAAREALGDAVSAYALARERRETEQIISERWGAWLRQADAYATAQAAAWKNAHDTWMEAAKGQADQLAAARAEAERYRGALEALVDVAHRTMPGGREGGAALRLARAALAEAPAQEENDEAD